jgi:hypothetical protein
MSWFATHLVMYVKLKDHPQRNYPLWENILLIEADSEEDAFQKAEQRGREDAGDDDGSFRWGGKPAEWVFAGVRKLTTCQDNERRPKDGTEITYIEMEAASKEALAKFVQGDPVSMKIADRFGDPVPG